MDVLTRLDVPYFPPEADEELIPRRYVDERSWGGVVPYVARVRVRRDGGPGNPGTSDMAGFSVVLELDRLAPANCWVQFWRSRRMAQRTGHYRNKTIGFGPMGHSTVSNGNTGGFPVVPVALGSRSVTAGTIQSLFRPGQVKIPFAGYSRYYRETSPAQWNNDLPLWMRNTGNFRRRDIKCILKFGLILRYRDPVTNYWIEQRSPPSAETVRIERWRYSWAGAGTFWGFNVNMF